jgi:hypothetical protein
MNIEEIIEEAVKDIMEARSYITTNSIPVVRYRDRLTTKGDDWVSVRAEPNERLSNNHDLYRVPLTLIAVSKSQEDLRSNSIDAIIAECNDEIQQDLTIVTLQAAIDAYDANSGVTVQGLVPTQGADTDGDYQTITANVDIFLTYTTDVADSNTMLLLNFNGNYTDESLGGVDSPHTATNAGGASIDAVNMKFGTGCLNLDGVDSKITIPDSEDLSGNGVMTVEFWLRINAQPGEGQTYFILGMDDPSGHDWQIQYATVSGQGRIFLSWTQSNGTSKSITVNSHTFTTDQWYYVTFIGDGANLEYSRDGVLTGGATAYDGTMRNLDGDLVIGSRDASDWGNFKMDGLRISDSIRYNTYPITVPTEEFTPYL